MTHVVYSLGMGVVEVPKFTISFDEDFSIVLTWHENVPNELNQLALIELDAYAHEVASDMLIMQMHDHINALLDHFIQTGQLFKLPGFDWMFADPS